MTEQPTTDQGWAFPGTATKCHYFRADQRALCGRWASIGMPYQMFSPDSGTSRQDCVACRRVLDKEGVR